jgi:mRNA interferase MazF
VVIQNNVFNASRMRTVVVSVLTSNPRRASDVGNVPLEPGEAGLGKPSVVNVSQVLTIDKEQLGAPIGCLDPGRVRQILDGLRLMTEPRELDGVDDRPLRR